MKPIEIRITGLLPRTPQEICAMLVDTDRWPDFTGYSILPGIASARFVKKTPEWVGSRIEVRNTDGSSHVEEIIEWNPEERVALRFQEFTPPLGNLATQFIETWEFHKSAAETEAVRKMAMYPKGIFGWLMLIPISRLMKKAFAKNLLQQGN